MKIVFIIGSLAGGGAERVVSELASCMVRQNNDVYIITVASSKIDYSISSKVNIIDCSKRESVPGVNFIRRLSRIKNTIKQVNPDVCISFTVAVNIYSVLSCIGAKTKLILAERNDPRFDPPGKVMRILRKILYPFADNFVFQTEGEKKFFSKRIQKKSVVIPNPVNPELPEPYQGERTNRFVSAVRLTPQKNLKMSIDAFSEVVKKYPEFRLEIYGDGELRNELEDYIKNKGLHSNVFLKGRSSDLYNDIKDAYGFILSSNYEGISNSMLEAMALGIPTISTDYPSGGAREIIESYKNGILVNLNDYKQLAKEIITLIEDRELCRKISSECRKIRNQLDSSKITDKWICYIHEQEGE